MATKTNIYRYVSTSAKIVLYAMIIIPTIELNAAGCEYYGNWTASDTVSFQTPDCPSGYVETSAYIQAVDGTSCPSGYVDVSARYKEVMCDNSRGTCSSSYVCPVP